MQDAVAHAGTGRRVLTLFLVVGNLAMLAAGIVTIPPNVRGLVDGAGVGALVEELPSAPAGDVAPAAVHGDATTPAGERRDLSTDERPDLDDFFWYTEVVVYDGVPADAVAVDSLSDAAGGWKALIIYDPEGLHESSAIELLNANVGGTEDDLHLTLDWYLIYWLGDESAHDETEMEDTEFTGHWEGGGLWVSGAGTMRLTDVYSLDDAQYAIGTIVTPDGIPAYIALTRP